MKELLNKLAAAKAEIKATKLKKEGKNTFSNYEYFTPSQIEFLVATACGNNNLLTTFDLCRNDLGVYGKLNLYDLESGKMLSTEMASAIPEIKATNVAQQLGGCSTYTERYMKQSMFGITDNQLDFDTTENTKKQADLDMEELQKTDKKRYSPEKYYDLYTPHFQHLIKITTPSFQKIMMLVFKNNFSSGSPHSPQRVTNNKQNRTIR